MLIRGSVDFRNMSRYSKLSEKTFSRQFGNPSDFAIFNMIGTGMSVNSDTLMIAATDCSFIAESGSHTYGLGRFYNGSRAETEKGPGISEPAVVDVNHNTAYSVSTWQTPDTLTAGHTRTDRYVEHSVQDAPCLPQSVRYPAADGYYARRKFADGVTASRFRTEKRCGPAPDVYRKTERAGQTFTAFTKRVFRSDFCSGTLNSLPDFRIVRRVVK